MRIRVFATILAVFIGGAISDAQQPPPEKPKVEPAEAAAEAEPWERLIYVPYRNLKSVFEKHPSTVFLPYLEYLKLWERAGGAAREASGPPVPGVITESSYVGTVDDNLARIKAILKVQVLGKAWSEIPVNFGQAAIGKISSPQGQVLLRGTGAGKYALLFPKPGAYQVTLELTTRIRSSADGHSFELDCPTVGMTTFELAIPRPSQTVDLKPQLVALPIEAAEGQTRIRARLGATPKIAALWYPKVGLKPDMDLLTSVENYQHVSIRDGLVHTDAHLVHDVLRGELTQLRIAIPKGHRILDVVSPQAKIKLWKKVEEENRQVVTVEFLAAVRKQFVLEVHTERPAPAMGEVFAVSGIDPAGINKSTIDDPGMKVHGIHSLDAVRESGQVVVTHGADLTLTVQPPRGLVRIEPGEVRKEIRRTGGQSYKFYSPRFDLQVAYEPVQPRITVEHATRLEFRDDDLRLLSQLKYTVERAGVFEWKVRLPEGLELDDVRGTAYKEHDYDPATRMLSVSLAQRRQGALSLVVTAHRSFDGEAETADVDLPVLEPLGVVRESGKISVYAPDAYEVVTDESKLEGIQPDRTSGAARAIGRARLASSWQYTSYPTGQTPRSLVLPVTTRRRPTRLAATVATIATARQQLVKVETTVLFMVEYAGVETFRIQVPELPGVDGADAQEVQITSIHLPGVRSASGRRQTAALAIREKTAGEAEDGWVIWTITMQREVTGPQAFRVTWDVKPPGEDEKATALRKVLVQPPRPLDLDNENIVGEILVVKDRSLEVTTSDPDKDQQVLEVIDVRELQLLPKTGSAAYRYHKQPVRLEITTREYMAEKVVETVISQGLVEAVISKDGQVGFRCRYRLKSSERQRLRVDLPTGCSTPEVYVDQRRVPAELHKTEENSAATAKEWKAYSINVARTRSNEEFFLTLRFDQTVEEFFANFFGGTQRLAFPQIGGASSADDQFDVVLQELRVEMWVPEDYTLVGTPDAFVIPHRNTGVWFQGQDRTENLVHFPTKDHGRRYVYSNLGGAAAIGISWWKAWTMTAGVSVPVFLIGLVLLWTPWSNRLGVLLVASFVAALWSRADADAVYHGLLAARWGLGFSLATWALAAVVGFRRSATLLSTLSRPGSADGDAGETEPASLDADESRTEKTTAAETSAGESVAEEETVEGDESEGDDRPEDVS